MEELKKEFERLGFVEQISYDNYSRFASESGKALLLEEKLILLNSKGEIKYEGDYPELEKLEEVINLLKDGE